MFSTRTENFPFSIPRTFVSASSGETFALGERFALMLEEGSVVALRGTLGAGKTCFTKGIARGLGVTEEITSPTYTIVSEYGGFLPGKESGEAGSRADGPGGGPPKKSGTPVQVYHIDAYRLKGDDDFSAIGGEEIVFGRGISIIEWSERVPDFIPREAFHVNIELGEDNKRRISIYRGEAQ